MSGLTNPDGSHTDQSPESHYMKIIFSPVMRSLTLAEIRGIDVDDNSFSFNDKGKKVTITIKVKS